MILFFCVFVILAVAYAMHHEGLFTAVTMFVNVLLAGFLAFEFWEPLADQLDGIFKGGAMAGLEDCLAMVMLFSLFLVILRLVTNSLAFNEIEFEPNVSRAGSIVFGLLAGYFVAGFLAVCFQTLPWHENFLGFQPRPDDGVEDGLRSYLPPDRVWLAMMRRAGANTLCWREIDAAPEANFYDRYRTFDPYGTFELRYQRYRRYNEKDGKYMPPKTYQGEFDQDLERK
jgi:hypothetical protein